MGSSFSWMTPSMSILSKMACALVGLIAWTSTSSPVCDTRMAGPLLTSFCRPDLAAAHRDRGRDAAGHCGQIRGHR